MQEVNLLSEDLIPSNDPFTLRELCIALGLFALLLSSLSGWQSYQAWSTTKQTTKSQQQLAALEQEISQLKAQTDQQVEPALAAELANASQQRDDLRKLSTVLKKESFSSGFHQHLVDLASVHMRKLWFDSIEITKGGQYIRLAGFSEAAELVPLYLSQLSQGDAFAGYKFDGMQIERETDALVSFEVRGPAPGRTL